MKINDVVSAVIHGNFTNDELNQVYDALKFAKSKIARQVKREIVIGDTVKFTNSKTGLVYTGKLQKKAIKFATVSTPSGVWRVPMSMLTVV